VHGFTGYFMLYNLPFRYLPLFDYAEKKRIWSPGGVNQGKSVFDLLENKKIPYHVHQYGQSDAKKLSLLKKKIIDESINFAYISMGGLDSLMHKYGTNSERVEDKIEWYSNEFTKLLDLSEQHYSEVRYYVFTDHGMHNTQSTCDLQKQISQLKLKFGRDYAVVYDSTMARFWYLNDNAKNSIRELLSDHKSGRILSQKELEDFGVYFQDGKFGEDIFLMNSGIQICPSFMGQNFTAGLHGFHPDDKDSYAQICGSRKLPRLESIKDIYQLMTSDVDWLTS
jgi:predicted AlkP superfamily pyrophosphatase or phosphodiesterase